MPRMPDSRSMRSSCRRRERVAMASAVSARGGLSGQPNEAMECFGVEIAPTVVLAAPYHNLVRDDGGDELGGLEILEEADVFEEPGAQIDPEGIQDGMAVVGSRRTARAPSVPVWPIHSGSGCRG